MKHKINLRTAILVLVLIHAGGLFAKVSPDEAARLDKDLTPVGAERAGNQSGSIPAWTGGLKDTPASFEPGKPYPDAFPEDKVLFTIDQNNLDEYASKLSEGQKAMLRKYSSYNMPVFETRRSAGYTDEILGMIDQNVVNAELQIGGNGLLDFVGAFPFPIPQNGLEVLWNHIQRNKGGSFTRKYIHATPTEGGKFTPVTMFEEYADRYALHDFKDNQDGNLMFYFKQAVVAPSRLAGNVLLVHETVDQVKEPRRGWIYNAGQRRVRRAPQVSHDSPATASDGLMTSDNFDMFNGAPDHYDWKLVGKQELYIPYNAYRLDSKSLKYEDIVLAGHINNDYARYELHRVWKVEATIKDGTRNIYSKRTFYFDEDSWGIVVADFYDGRGALWRTAEAHTKYFYDLQAVFPTVEVHYDLDSGRYIVSGLANELRAKFTFDNEFETKDFTPAALRRAGRR